MEFIHWIKKIEVFVTSIIVVFRSLIGQVILLLSLILFDGISNSFAIAQIFEKRVAEYNWEYSLWLVLSVSAVASFCLGLGIFATAIINEKTRKASNLLALISFVMSFIGFVMLVMPENIQSFNELLTPYMITVLFFCAVLAGFSPYLMGVLSRNVANTNQEAFRKFGDKLHDITQSYIVENLEKSMTTKQTDTTKVIEIKKAA